MLPVRDHLPTRTRPVVNYALIVINLIVFAVEVSSASAGGELGSLSGWVLVPDKLVSDPVHSLGSLFGRLHRNK